MSVEALAWAFDQDIPDHAAKLTLIALANNTVNEHNEAVPSQKEIARFVNASRQTVNAKCQWLAEAGYITIEHRGSAEGGRMSNLYTLHVGLSQQARQGLSQSDEEVKSEDPTGLSQYVPTGKSLKPKTLKPHSSEEQVLPRRGADAPRRTNDRPPDLLFEAVAAACYDDAALHGNLTKDERGRVNAAVKQLREINASPDDVRRAFREARRLWPAVTTISPQALTANWHSLLPQGQLQPPCPACGTGGGLHAADCPAIPKEIPDANVVPTSIAQQARASFAQAAGG